LTPFAQPVATSFFGAVHLWRLRKRSTHIAGYGNIQKGLPTAYLSGSFRIDMWNEDSVDDGNSEVEPDWSTKIQALKEEGWALWKAIISFEREKILTQEQAGDVFHQLTEVFWRAGTGDPKKMEQSALTYALYRDAIHQLRICFAKMHPELVDELNKNAPPQISR
jgi:hypothetical protein